MICVCVCVWMFSFYLLLVSLSFKCRRISSRRCKPPVSPKVKISAAIVVLGSMALENRSVRCPRIIKIAWIKKYMFANRRNCSIRLLHGQQIHGEYFLVTIALSQNWSSPPASSRREWEDCRDRHQSCELLALPSPFSWNLRKFSKLAISPPVLSLSTTLCSIEGWI